jgi:large repetitive protein
VLLACPVCGTLAGSAVAPQALVMQIPDGYLPGVPMEVGLQVVLMDGTVDRDLWDATALLSIDSPAVTALTQSVRLYNGQGTARMLFTGSGDFNLTATVDGMEATRSLGDRSHEPVQLMSGTLDAASANWQGIVHVTGDLRVPAGLTLTIQPGTLILIDGVASGNRGADIDVQGSIRSLGTDASPIVFTASDPSKPWGELHHEAGSVSLYQHTQIILAGHSPGGGHTGRGPAVRAQNATITFEHCVLADEAGKIMQASDSGLTFRQCVLARSVMGPEIEGTALCFEDGWITEMLNPDDADGMYIHDQSAGQICLMKGGVVADVNDDCIDTLGSDVTLEDLIIRDAQDKGVSIYGGRVDILHCLIVENNRAPEDPTIAAIAAKTFEGSTATVNIDYTTVVASKVEGHTDTGIQSHNKTGVKAGVITYNVTNSIIEASDPVSVQAPYLASDVHIQFSDIFGEPWPGQSNLDTDPLFVNPAEHDYHLQEGSPCRGVLQADGEPADVGYYPYDPNQTLPPI